MMITQLSARQARRIALNAQGFGRPVATGLNEKVPNEKALFKLVDRLGVVQIDSINVVARTHYLPAFSRLGHYPRSALENIAWGDKPKLFEYWGHEASLLPLALQPLLRWRMADARDGVGVWKNVARFLIERRDLVDAAMAQIQDRGPLAASDLDLGAKGPRGWWGWSEAKRAVECLFWCGELTSITRRGSFERVFAPMESALPPKIIQQPTPSRASAQTQLLGIAARAMGVATERDLRDYFRMGVADTKTAIARLIEQGEVQPVTVEGWPHPAYLHRSARAARPCGDALLSPFDNAIWFRERTERLFDVRVRLEVYTPAAQRIHGYYVLPFLQDDLITARVDLKADRKSGTLIVQASHAERSATTDTAERLACELRRMAQWLGLDDIRVIARGELAPALAGVVAKTS
jgi:hypothetical protein